MTTILDCIERTPPVLERILEQQEQVYAEAASFLKERTGKLREIVLLGCGTSYTASVTAQYSMERVSGLPVRVMYPNDIAGGRICAPDSLYVFLSQTGTSGIVCEMMEKLSGQGYFCMSMTESPQTRLAKLSPCHICLNCGKEEFSMRTLGYTASVLDLILLGVKIGLAGGFLSRERSEALLREAAKVPDSQRAVIPEAKEWYQKRKRQFSRSDCILFTGAGALYGLALEGAVKLWEMPQIISAGLELEDGMHGPNFGYDGRQCVVILDDGGAESGKAHRLARYVKEIMHNGLLVGPVPLGEEDFVLRPRGGLFSCLEYSVVPQIMSYFLAVDAGRDISGPMDRSVMNRYFKTHS